EDEDDGPGDRTSTGDREAAGDSGQPGPRLHLPRMRHTSRMVRGAPHRPLGRRRQNRRQQPHVGLLCTPPLDRQIRLVLPNARGRSTGLGASGIDRPSQGTGAACPIHRSRVRGDALRLSCDPLRLGPARACQEWTCLAGCCLGMKLSILDLVPVRTGQTTADSFAASKQIIDKADKLGFTRYWVAEHHNMPSIASTMPGPELMHLGQVTERIRLGSGGVMLPNHAPLAVAELFALLAAVYGDRIDLGIGRAPGTDPITSAAMRGHLGEGRMVDREGRAVDPVEQFPQHVIDTLSLMTPEGLRIPLHGGREHVLKATPAAVPGTRPLPWLLGSSGYSARLAAELGMPYVFANHFASGATTGMKIYRDNFTPGAYGDQPRTFVTANVVVAPTAEEAQLRSEPFLLQMSRLRTGGPME